MKHILRTLLIGTLMLTGSLQSKTILVVGGAGYIGSHTAFALHQEGYDIIIIDKYIHNQQCNPEWATIIKADFGDKELLHTIFTTYDIEAVMHFAAFIEVGESVQNPIKYYENNVGKTTILLQSMIEHGINTFIFSSTAAVYGIPTVFPIPENHTTAPINPYGQSKLMVESICNDLATRTDFKFFILRYFNASGAWPEHNLGEQHNPETHIIPLLLRAADQRTAFKVFGTDYDTHDGTALRDYLHVRDIADAHVKALHYLEKGNTSEICNLGTGIGTTVREMLNAATTVTGCTIDPTYCDRRPGDPPRLVADAQKAYQLLEWKPEHSDIIEIITSAWQWYQKMQGRDGYSTHVHSAHHKKRLHA